MGNAAKQMSGCGKCDATGRIRAFSHYAAGVCFDCGGTGRIYHDPISAATLANEAARHARDTAVRALAAKIGLKADGSYTALGCMVLECDAERHMWPEIAAVGSRHHRLGPARRAFWAEVSSIVDAAVDARAIAPSAVARLSEMAIAWAGWDD
jgi:hypothetical protein